MSDRQFHVGQILFIGSNKKNSVVPVQVKKRTIEETIEGNKVTYFIATPKNPNVIVELDKIGGQIFTSIDEAKRIMTMNAERSAQDFLQKARAQIDKMIRVAAKVSERFPQVGAPPRSQQSVALIDEYEDLLELPAEETIYDEVDYQQPPPPPQVPPMSSEENMIMVPDPNDPEKMIPVKVGNITISQKQE